jgi:hypothetical protein
MSFFSLRVARLLLVIGSLASFCVPLDADTLSRKSEIDFFREIPSRNLKGFATRSDGRLVAGPALTDLAGSPPADLLWCLAPGADASHWLIGSGPDGRIFEATIDAAAGKYATRELVKLEDPHVFALARLPDGTVLAGTSPRGALCLIRDGKQVARIALPVDSIFDLLMPDSKTVLVATGNPGRIYRVDLAKFAAGGVAADKLTDAAALATRGVTLFAEIRDRNLRRLVRLADGRIAAGSSPKGNVYVFPRDGGAPVFLQENREAEVTDLLPQPNGDLYASIVFSSSSGESRITPPPKTGKDAPKETEALLATPPEKFNGRSSLIWFPANGFPEVLTSRSGIAFYRLARHDDQLIVAGGELGELIGYDLNARLSLTFAGSVSSQLNMLAPIPGPKNGSTGKFLLLRNNAAGLALLDFNGAKAREAETRRIDLGVPATLGTLRFNRLRDLPESQLAVEVRVSSGSDEVEGWGPWTPLKFDDGGWKDSALRGRYLKLRLRATSPSPGLEIDKATLFAMPQNHRPVLQEFRVLSPNFALVVQPESVPSPITSLSQLTSGKDDDKSHKGNLLSSQVVPAPGTQVVLWNISDSDGDSLVATFSIRRENESAWTDVVVDSHDSYAQFDTEHLADGIYFTRLVATETAPRAPEDRLSATFETDDLVVDHTRPEILDATAKRGGANLVISVHGRDALSLLDGIEVLFNNGYHDTLEQPVDGVRDGKEETFTLDLPYAKVANATSVEVTLYDSAGNGATKRLVW